MSEKADIIIDELRRIRICLERNAKYDQDIEWNKHMNILLQLPDHLRTTVLALIKLKGVGSADHVKDITKRARAVESGYMNQMVLMGLLKKERRGRIAYFSMLDNIQENDVLTTILGKEIKK